MVVLVLAATHKAVMDTYMYDAHKSTRFKYKLMASPSWEAPTPLIYIIAGD